MTEESRAPVAVVVVSWNSACWLPGCLEALRALRRPPTEVVVVDNGSTDGSPALVREGWPEVDLLALPDNLGFCAANNRGIARTASPFVLLLNPDAFLDPGYLEELLPAFEDPQVAIASGKLRRLDGATLDSAGQELGRSRAPVDRGYGRPDTGRYDLDEEVFGACGAAALYRRAALERVADPHGEVLTEEFFAFYEDLDLAWRLRRGGYRAVYRPRATARHARGSTAGTEAVRRRFRAMLSRPPAVRFHLVKNRYLAILRNDRPGAYLRDLPFILARDLATVGLLAATSPGVLGRLWRERGMFRRALARRRVDAARFGTQLEARRPR